MKPLISVIVPIYDVEKYIDSCLHSIRKQTLKNIEIICVDDCSPDNSSTIIEKHQEEDSRISLIYHASNTGLGGARNTGICMAKADFITGVDSDDTIKPDMLEKLWKASENGKYDIVCCGFDTVDEAGKIKGSHSLSARSINRHDESINVFTALNPAFWNKLWKRSLFIDHDIFFPEQEYYEDMSTTPRLVSRATQVKIIKDTLYNYLVRQGSITTSYSEKHILDYFKGFDVLLSHLNKVNAPEYQYGQLISYIDRHIAAHANSLLNTNLRNNETKLSFYLKDLILLKISFVESYSLFINKSAHELLNLINNKDKSGALNQRSQQLEQEKISLINESNTLKDIIKNSDNEKEKLAKESQKQQVQIMKFKNESIVDKKRIIAAKKQLQTTVVEKDAVQNALIKRQEKTILSNEKLHKQLDLNSRLRDELSQQSHQLKLLLVEKDNLLSGTQKAGVLLYKVVVWPFTSPQKYSKLNDTPKQFFRDSKSYFSLFVGSLLKLK